MSIKSILLTAVIVLAGCKSEAENKQVIPVEPDPGTPSSPSDPDESTDPKPSEPSVPSVPLVPAIRTYSLDSAYERSFRFNLAIADSNANTLSGVTTTTVNQASEPPETFTFTDITLFEEEGNLYLKNGTPEYLDEIYVRLGEEYHLVKFSEQVPPFSESVVDKKLTGAVVQFPLNLHLPNVKVEPRDCSTHDTLCYGKPLPAMRSIYYVHLVNMRNSLNRSSFWEFSDEFINSSSYADVTAHSESWDYVKHNLLLLGTRNLWLEHGVMYHEYSSEGVAHYSSLPKIGTGEWQSGWCRVSIYGGYIDKENSGYRPFDWKTVKTYFHETAHCYGKSHSSGFTYGLADNYGAHYVSDSIDEAEHEEIGARKVAPYVFGDKQWNGTELTVSVKSHPDLNLDEADLEILNYHGFSGTITFDDGKIILKPEEGNLPTMTTYLMLRDPTKQTDYMSTLRVLASEFSVSE